jgi:hypothetical protein
MDLLLLIFILALVALFTSFIVTIVKKRYDSSLGIGIMIIVLIILKFLLKIN